MSAVLTRRALVAGAGAALGTAALPVVAAPDFDPAAYCADLKALGYQPYAFRKVLSGGALGPWRYGIAADRGFGADFDAVIRRWSKAAGSWVDKHDRVAAYIAGGGWL